MSERRGPHLKSVPGGLKPDDVVEVRPRKVSERNPTARLPDPSPSPPPVPSTGEDVPKATPHRAESLPQSLSTTAEFAAVHPIVKKQFGRYELLMQMGSGGMATLYLARIRGPQKFEKLLAIKKIHEHLLTEKEFVDMFRDEARIAALIHHPNVAGTFDLGFIDGSYFIAMEYVHGQTLRDVVNAGVYRKDPVHWSYAVRIVSDVAKGLHAAHTLCSHAGEALNVIHRDVSPQNILVSYDGHVKLVDFGIAYAAEKLSHTDAGKLKGKAGYMSPEQVSGQTVDHRSDIFSLGTVLFETLTMRRLFKEDNDASTILRVRAARVPDVQQLCPLCPPELNAIAHKALARAPDDRYPTAEAFAEALDELLVDVGERVGRKQLSGLMEDLFYERKRIKDRMRRRALSGVSASPIQGIEAVDDGTASLLINRMSTATADGLASKRFTRLLFAGMAGGLVVLAVVVGWLVMRGDRSKRSQGKQGSSMSMAAVMTEPRPVADQRPRPMRQRPVAASSVMLMIRVSPKEAKATITFRREVQQGGIFQAALPTSTSREEVTITAPGFQRRVIPIVLSQSLTLPVELVPDAAAELAAQKRRKQKKRLKRKKHRPRVRPMSMLVDL